MWSGADDQSRVEEKLRTVLANDSHLGPTKRSNSSHRRHLQTVDIRDRDERRAERPVRESTSIASDPSPRTDPADGNHDEAYPEQYRLGREAGKPKRHSGKYGENADGDIHPADQANIHPRRDDEYFIPNARSLSHSEIIASGPGWGCELKVCTSAMS